MRIAIVVFFLMALVCEAFGYWGLNAIEGRQTFDEMAGIVPFASQVLGGLFGACAAFLWWRDARKKL